MTEEQLKALLKMVKGDTSLQEKFKAAASPDAAVEIAKDAGFSITTAITIFFFAITIIGPHTVQAQGVPPIPSDKRTKREAERRSADDHLVPPIPSGRHSDTRIDAGPPKPDGRHREGCPPTPRDCPPWGCPPPIPC